MIDNEFFKKDERFLFRHFSSQFLYDLTKYYNNIMIEQELNMEGFIKLDPEFIPKNIIYDEEFLYLIGHHMHFSTNVLLY